MTRAQRDLNFTNNQVHYILVDNNILLGYYVMGLVKTMVLPGMNIRMRLELKWLLIV
jgi:hypothetical protein